MSSTISLFLLVPDAPLQGIEPLRVWLFWEEFRWSCPESGPSRNQRFAIVTFLRHGGDLGAQERTSYFVYFYLITYICFKFEIIKLSHKRSALQDTLRARCKVVSPDNRLLGNSDGHLHYKNLPDAPVPFLSSRALFVFGWFLLAAFGLSLLRWRSCVLHLDIN